MHHCPVFINARTVDKIGSAAAGDRGRDILAVVDEGGQDAIDCLADPTAEGVISVAGNGGAVACSDQLASIVPRVTPGASSLRVAVGIVGVSGTSCSQHRVTGGAGTLARGFDDSFSTTGGLKPFAGLKWAANRGISIFTPQKPATATSASVTRKSLYSPSFPPDNTLLPFRCSNILVGSCSLHRDLSCFTAALKSREICSSPDIFCNFSR